MLIATHLKSLFLSNELKRRKGLYKPNHLTLYATKLALTNFTYLSRQFKGKAFGVAMVQQGDPVVHQSISWTRETRENGCYTIPITSERQGRGRGPVRGMWRCQPSPAPSPPPPPWTATVSLHIHSNSRKQTQSGKLGRRGGAIHCTDPSSVCLSLGDLSLELTHRSQLADGCTCLPLVSLTLLKPGEPLRRLFRTHPSASMFWKSN